MARRSVLFAPGDDPEKLRTAAAGDADVVVFDLEDAVAPTDTDEARGHVRTVLADVSTEAQRCVRVNQLGAGMIADIEAVLSGPHPDSVMLPKTEAAADVQALAGVIAEHDADLPVLALVETAAGILGAEAIAAANPTAALLFGAEDLAADIGATRTGEGTEVRYARERVVIAASAADIDAIDTVYTDFEDLAGLRDETAFAAQLGYDGKMVIHPDQVPVVNEAFTPSEERITWAERVIAAATETDAAVFQVDGEMIDAPLITQAERILDRAEQADRR